MTRLKLCALGILLVVLIPPMTAHPARAIGKTSTALSPARIAFTQNGNVYLMDLDGGNRQIVTTRATLTSGISYPWYQWSPDGRYLLVVRQRILPTYHPRWDLLLMNQTGELLHTLVTNAPDAYGFPPTWATDADVIAYVASSSDVLGQPEVVHRVDVQGITGPLWSFTPVGQCGGYTPDPSAQLYMGETGYAGTAPTVQWSLTHHFALYSSACSNGRIAITDYATQSTRILNAACEATYSSAGRLAAVNGYPFAGTSQVILTDLQSSRPSRIVGLGEQPRWSSDGRWLYYIGRTKGTTLTMYDELGNEVPMETYTSSIWKANADGSAPVRLLTADAYSLNAPQETSDGQFLIFSRVDNQWVLWQHRLSGNRFTNDLLHQYGPGVRIQRLDLMTGQLTTLATDASRPVVQP